MGRLCCSRPLINRPACPPATPPRLLQVMGSSTKTLSFTKPTEDDQFAVGGNAHGGGRLRRRRGGGRLRRRRGGGRGPAGRVRRGRASPPATVLQRSSAAATQTNPPSRATRVARGPSSDRIDTDLISCLLGPPILQRHRSLRPQSSSSLVSLCCRRRLRFTGALICTFVCTAGLQPCAAPGQPHHSVKTHIPAHHARPLLKILLARHGNVVEARRQAQQAAAKPHSVAAEGAG